MHYREGCIKLLVLNVGGGLHGPALEEVPLRLVQHPDLEHEVCVLRHHLQADIQLQPNLSI